MSNGEQIYSWATCKHFLQVGSVGPVVAYNATTGPHGSISRYKNAAQAERIAFERYESFDAQHKKQLAAGEQSDIVELEKIAESAKKLPVRDTNEK